MPEDKVYSVVDDLPEDAELITKSKDFDPIDPSNIYQVEVLSVQLRDNIFYKPDAKENKDKGSKYQFSFEFAILDEGTFYGRRIWDTTSLVFKPDGRRGPTKLYKIVTAALKTAQDVEKFAPDLKTFYKNLVDQVEGAQLKVAIENVPTESGKVRTKIVTYNSAKEDLTKFDQEKANKTANAAPADEEPGDDSGEGAKDIPF